MTKVIYVSETEKICTICNQVKHFTEFNRGASSKDGRRAYCKDCQKVIRIRYESRISTKTVTEKACARCQVVKANTEFYPHSGRLSGLSSWCKQCTAIVVEIRTKQQRQQKSKLVELLGGSCQRCGYNEFLSSLEFHHVNPVEKNQLVNRKGSEEQKMREADKCALLCSNCHEALESGYWKAEFIKCNGLGYTIKK